MNISAAHIGVLVLSCLGIVLLGGWYVQTTLVELKTENFELNLKVTLLKEQMEKTKQYKDVVEFIRGLQSQQQMQQNATDTNHQNIQQPNTNSHPLKLLRGRDGRDGRDGVQGIKGDVGPRGDKGLVGPKGEPAGGVVYVRWGHNSCPSNGAELVYSGRAGGSFYNQKGGGGNPQCLPLDPNYLAYEAGPQTRSLMYGAEYEQTNSIRPNSHDTDVPCAVCYAPKKSTVYMIPAKYTCPTGWTREYYGYLMAGHYVHQRTQFSCVDSSLTPVPGSSKNDNGFLFYLTEGRCGSLPCPPYEETKELTCAVCTK